MSQGDVKLSLSQVKADPYLKNHDVGDFLWAQVHRGFDARDQWDERMDTMDTRVMEAETQRRFRNAEILERHHGQALHMLRTRAAAMLAKEEAVTQNLQVLTNERQHMLQQRHGLEMEELRLQDARRQLDVAEKERDSRQKAATERLARLRAQQISAAEQFEKLGAQAALHSAIA